MDEDRILSGTPRAVARHAYGKTIAGICSL
jgi:hypothetical protein